MSEKFYNPEDANVDIEAFFSRALLESSKDPNVSILFESIDLDAGKKIFELIKENLLRHKDADPMTWDDPSYHYGHVGILLTEENKDLATHTFPIPSLNIKITVGKIRELPSGPGMRIVWEKV